MAAELIEPGLSVDLTERGQGYLPDPRDSAMAHAMDKAAAGLLDPRDVEVRFIAFETLMLRRSQRQGDPISSRRDGGAP